MPTPIPIVIDTDIGGDPDDALALSLAIASPEVDLLGVTVVGEGADFRARMVARVLGMGGRLDIPVFSADGLKGKPTLDGFEGRGLMDLPYDGPDATVHEQPAPEWLVEESRRRPFHLVSIGTMTNIAKAVQADPEFAGQLSHLTIMGGLFDESALPAVIQQDVRERGVRAAWPDYNTWADPDAALVCAKAGAPTTWVTVEVTFTVPVHRSTLDVLPPDQPLSAALRGLIDAWQTWWLERNQPFITNEDAIGGTFLHDPLAVASLFSDDWLTLQTHPLRYAIEDGVFRMHKASPDNADTDARVSIAADGAAVGAFCFDRIARHLNRMNAS